MAELKIALKQLNLPVGGVKSALIGPLLGTGKTVAELKTLIENNPSTGLNPKRRAHRKQRGKQVKLHCLLLQMNGKALNSQTLELLNMRKLALGLLVI